MKNIFLKWIIFSFWFCLTFVVFFLWYAAWTNIPNQSTWTTISPALWNQLVDNINTIWSKVEDIPVFSVYMNNNQSSTLNVIDKVLFDTKEFDTNSFFDISTNSFKPTKAGYYFITARITMSWVAWWGSTSWLYLYKNGTQLTVSHNLQNYTSSFGQTLHISKIIYFNGTTDYLDVRYSWNGWNSSLLGSSAYNSFAGYYVRP